MPGHTTRRVVVKILDHRFGRRRKRRSIWQNGRCEFIGREVSRGGVAVAYDQELAERIRRLVADEAGLTEMKMFGGLAFLINGNMAISASGQRGAMVRVDPSESEKIIATTDAQLVEMRGREMPGWLRVDKQNLRTEPELAMWVKLGTAFARSLPPKR